MKIIAAISACASLMACTSLSAHPHPEIPERGVTPGYKCNADSLQSMVGQKATGELGERALKLSGAKRLRWMPPNTAVTMDYRTDRLNIAYDEKMVINRIGCG